MLRPAKVYKTELGDFGVDRSCTHGIRVYRNTGRPTRANGRMIATGDLYAYGCRTRAALEREQPVRYGNPFVARFGPDGRPYVIPIKVDVPPQECCENDKVVTENPDGSFRVRLTPDRAENLEGIADAVLKILVHETAGQKVYISVVDADRLAGYAEQLRIIADDWRALQQAKKPDNGARKITASSPAIGQPVLIWWTDRGFWVRAERTAAQSGGGPRFRVFDTAWAYPEMVGVTWWREPPAPPPG